MTKIIVDITHNQSPVILSRLDYVCSFLCNHPCAPPDISILTGKDVGDILINYSNIYQDGSIRMHDARLCFSSDIADISAVETRSFIWKEMTLSGFCRPGFDDDLFPVDIFQTIFFHISRYEEWFYKKAEDTHGMMAAPDQYLVESGLYRWPIVDRLVYYFYDRLGLQPKKIRTRYRLTHDIDAIIKFPTFYKFLRSAGNIILYRKNKILSLARLIKSYTLCLIGKTKDPFDTFDWLLIADSQKMMDKKIYFLCGGSTKYDHFYNIKDIEAIAILQQAGEKGYNIGIHPSYNSNTDGRLIKKEKAILEEIIHQKVVDSRQHFLRYSIAKTGEILENEGIKTDSSIGYRDRIGFRAGTGFPYSMYNFNQENTFDFEEIPLVVMDGAAMEEAGWRPEEFIRLITSFLRDNSYYTQITFNFHNSFFDPALTDRDRLIAFYRELFC